MPVIGPTVRLHPRPLGAHWPHVTHGPPHCRVHFSPRGSRSQPEPPWSPAACPPAGPPAALSHWPSLSSPKPGHPGALEATPARQKMASAEDDGDRLLRDYANGFMVSQVPVWGLAPLGTRGPQGRGLGRGSGRPLLPGDGSPCGEQKVLGRWPRGHGDPSAPCLPPETLSGKHVCKRVTGSRWGCRGDGGHGNTGCNALRAAAAGAPVRPHSTQEVVARSLVFLFSIPESFSFMGDTTGQVHAEVR